MISESTNPLSSVLLALMRKTASGENANTVTNLGQVMELGRYRTGGLGRLSLSFSGDNMMSRTVVFKLILPRIERQTHWASIPLAARWTT